MASGSARRMVVAVVVTVLGVAGVNAARGEGDPPRATAVGDAPVTIGSVTHAWTVGGGRTHVDRLRVSGIAPTSATVIVQCHGPGCPFATRSVRPTGDTANLVGLFG